MSTRLFLRDVVARPLEMGAVAPSSRSLARRMVEEADIRPGQAILELGAGSGSFTEEIVAQHPENPLILVEPGAALATALQARFPRALVLPIRAEQLADADIRKDLPVIDRVVSGLPWAIWPVDRQAALLDAVMPLLSSHATLVTFHYVHSRLLGATAALRDLFHARFGDVSDSDVVWTNLPPAYVHRATRPRW